MNLTTFECLFLLLRTGLPVGRYQRLALGILDLRPAIVGRLATGNDFISMLRSRALELPYYVS